MHKNSLVIGQKNYSSWSLRGWLVLRWAGIEFDEHLIDLAQEGYGQGRIAEVLSASPNGLVPALQLGDITIWDTLAIAEWTAEQVPSMWPKAPMTRALARSVTAEMHSGFVPLRRDLPMNILRRCNARDLPLDTQNAINRVMEIWTEMRQRHSAEGAWLFGRRSIADAFFLPIATRFRTYGITLNPTAQAYSDTLLSDNDFREWEAASIPDSWDASGFSVLDGLYR